MEPFDFITGVPEDEGWFLGIDAFGRVRNLFVTWAYKPPIELTVGGVHPLTNYHWAVGKDGAFIRPDDK